MELNLHTSPTAIGVLCLGIVSIVLLALRYVRDPLRHVPGPRLARFSGIAYMWAGVKFRQVQYLQHLHDEYGPVVRFAPSQVSFSDVGSFKTIHKLGANFTKDASYHYMNASFGEYESLFSTSDTKLHNQRRRLFAKSLSAASLRRNWQDVVSERVRFTVQCIRSDFEKHGSVDVAKWWRLMASDISSWLFFGDSFECLEAGEKAPYMEAIEKTAILGFLHLAIPPPLFSLLKRLPWPKPIRELLDVPKYLMSQGAVAVTHSKASSGTKNIFADALRENEKENGLLRDIDIQTEAGTFITAGTETTADTFLSLIWSVLAQPDLQKSIEEEVSSVTDLDDAGLEELPILNSVIEETLRLYGAGNGPLPRLVPPSGANIHGSFIPGGTVVSSSAYFFQRDPAVFPDPEKFDHTRFLRENSPAAKKASMAPWGGGTRICIGMHLALMEMRMAAVEFFRECKGATLAPSMHGIKLGVKSIIFVTSPTSPRLDVVLKAA